MSFSAESLSQRVIRSGVDWSSAGLKLADFLAGRFTYRSRAEWEKRIIEGELTVNQSVVSPETVLKLHDVIEYHPSDIVEPPADLDYRIVFEDEHLLVIDKPGNLCMHPSGPFFKHTLWHLLCTRYGQIHFINRLDRETSGLLLAAKDADTARRLAKSGNAAHKRYYVIVHGDFTEPLLAAGFLSPDTGIIRKKRIFSVARPEHPPMENCETEFLPLRHGGGFSLLEALLHTGRMHQIRATLFSLGYPVVGDKLYGLDERFYLKQRTGELSGDDRRRLVLSRQALHSHSLEFCHPYRGEMMNFNSPLPAELEKLASTIKED